MPAARSHTLRAVLAALACLTAAPSAQAGAFLIRDQTAAGFGMALAGVAAGGELSYVFWNPATLADVGAFQTTNVVTGVFPSIDIHPSDGTNALVGAFGGTPTSSVDIAEYALVPAGFVAYPVNDRLTLGLASTSAFGLSTKAPKNWAGQVYSRVSEIFSVNLNPMVSYRINDMIAIGGGVQLEYFRAYLTQATALAADAPDATLRADNVGVGFNLGLQVRPWEGTTFGLGYRSSISHSLEGKLALPGARFAAEATLDTPDIVSLGLRQDVTERVRLLGTVEWNNWSRLGDIAVVSSDNGGSLTTLQLDYRDGWLYSLGAEYDATEKLTLRAGIGYETAPLTETNRDTRLPEVDQIILSAGLSYKTSEKLSFDLGYTFATGTGGGDIDLGPTNERYLGLPFEASSDLDVHIISAAVNYKFDGFPFGRR